MKKMNMSIKDIKADILTKWDRKRNTNCKFLPGDVVTLAHIDNIHDSMRICERKGDSATVVGVSSGAPGLIRGHWNRAFTRYYVQFEDGYTVGIHSHNLKLLSGV